VAGTLYVVATPLGNLGDLSHRAAELLRTVPVVAAEDTRHSLGLLHHLGARPRLISFHAHSPERRVETLLEILRLGEDVALVSDAGTPAVSDPGAELVAAARAAGITVVPLPGPSAVSTALSAAGLAADRYTFLGFLPRKGQERKRLLAQAAASPWTVVCYEAPPRLVALLEDLAEVAGADRQAVVARELTKLYEEFQTGTLAELAQHFEAIPPRGELTVLLAGLGHEAPVPAVSGEEAAAFAARLLAEGQTRKDTVRELVEQLGLPRNDAYRIVMELP
jgi:16S rRNA (cytidine1402-2'-O)-methyltransferase